MMGGMWLHLDEALGVGEAAALRVVVAGEARDAEAAQLARSGACPAACALAPTRLAHSPFLLPSPSYLLLFPSLSPMIR